MVAVHFLILELFATVGAYPSLLSILAPLVFLGKIPDVQAFLRPTQKFVLARIGVLHPVHDTQRHAVLDGVDHQVALLVGVNECPLPLRADNQFTVHSEAAGVLVVNVAWEQVPDFGTKLSLIHDLCPPVNQPLILSRLTSKPALFNVSTSLYFQSAAS